MTLPASGWPAGDRPPGLAAQWVAARRAREPGRRSCEGAGVPVEPEDQVELGVGNGSFPEAGL